MRWTADNAPDAKEMRNFTRATAEAFATYLAGELSPNSFNKCMTLFRRMWDVLSEEGRMTENPWAKIRHMALATHTRRELTVDEPADGADAAGGRLSAFRDVVRGMTADELKRARAEIDRLLATSNPTHLDAMNHK